MKNYDFRKNQVVKDYSMSVCANYSVELFENENGFYEGYDFMDWLSTSIYVLIDRELEKEYFFESIEEVKKFLIEQNKYHDSEIEIFCMALE